MTYDDSVYRTDYWFKSLLWQHQWIEKFSGWWVGQYGRPNTVVDLGCGDGWWLKCFHDMGAQVHGVELDIRAREHVPAQVNVHIHDLRFPVYLGDKADLVICSEVVEHLPRECENTILKTITDHVGGLLLFSAAGPGQQGTGHINLREQSYWINRITGFPKMQLSEHRTQETRHAFGNINNGLWDFLVNNLLVFARV